MASVDFPFNYTPGKLQEFLSKLQSVGTPEKISTDYPKSIGFGSSHARGFPSALKYIGLLDSSGAPTDVYKKGLRGGAVGRATVGAAIAKAYKPLFDVYPDANSHGDADLVTFVKSHSNHDDEKAGLVVRTFKALCKFGDFEGSGSGPGDDDEKDDDGQGNVGDTGSPRRRRNGGGSNSGVVINVNIALSVDATSDPAVYDAFFGAMATHLKGLMDGGS